MPSVVVGTGQFPHLGSLAASVLFLRGPSCCRSALTDEQTLDRLDRLGGHTGRHQLGDNT
ncbi:hypothetical protein VM1G_11405 [Cytospora mali]|uniref:Uncharacterized protein n=1 Tax=Cytospora mali TaxID=578113 RepID=A0A194VR46_CYTMA|nr:hypothetical protein VM1G_11405 [Valsa mali]